MKQKNVTILDQSIIEKILSYIERPLGSRKVHGYYFIDQLKYHKVQLSVYQIYENNYSYYVQDIKLALEKCGIDKTEFSSHDFRRLFARKVWNKWFDIERLKKLMGHSRVDTTLRYLESTGSDTEQLYAELEGFQ